jgi:predicted translin family RNA/ssDNA-binding protein
MFSTNLFQKLISTYQAYSIRRVNVIKDSSDILRASKQAIFALHINNEEEAENLLKDAREKIHGLSKEYEISDLKREGSFLAAIEEYMEAGFFMSFIKGEEIDFLKDFSEEFYEQYIGGICDFTGELVRKAINSVSENKTDFVYTAKKETEEVVGELIKFNITGKIRSKYDDARRNLMRLENMIYDLSIRDK